MFCLEAPKFSKLILIYVNGTTFGAKLYKIPKSQRKTFYKQKTRSVTFGFNY